MDEAQDRPVLPAMPSRLHREFDNIAAAPIKDHADKRRGQRGWRRAAAMNAVQMARSHAGKSDNDQYSSEESDIVVAIMELLDKVAEGT
jgi:cation transport regulator ChaB